MKVRRAGATTTVGGEAWRITKCAWDDTRALNTYLDDGGWDPFAVTDGNGVETVWLRRRSSDREAEAVQPSGPRLEDEVTRQR